MMDLIPVRSGIAIECGEFVATFETVFFQAPLMSAVSAVEIYSGVIIKIEGEFQFGYFGTSFHRIHSDALYCSRQLDLFQAVYQILTR